MGKAQVLFGTPSAATEYFYNRAFCGNWAPKPPVERWSADQRQRFEAELARLEAQFRPRAE